MSCLFRSLSNSINNTNETQLRLILVDYLAENPVLIVPDKKASEIIVAEFPNQKFENYLEKMRHSNTWGGAVEIKAFCELFSIQVNVVVLETRKTISFVPNKWETQNCTINDLRCITITWNGYHYEPIE